MACCCCRLCFGEVHVDHCRDPRRHRLGVVHLDKASQIRRRRVNPPTFLSVGGSRGSVSCCRVDDVLDDGVVGVEVPVSEVGDPRSATWRSRPEAEARARGRRSIGGRGCPYGPTRAAWHAFRSMAPMRVADATERRRPPNLGGSLAVGSGLSEGAHAQPLQEAASTSAVTGSSSKETPKDAAKRSVRSSCGPQPVIEKSSATSRRKPRPASSATGFATTRSPPSKANRVDTIPGPSPRSAPVPDPQKMTELAVSPSTSSDTRAPW